ncbi:DNA polymerase I [Corynebacterium heidelbergense]|uniref:DNA polymerase I n=1 Tax=Corynebacterium heidelbergense TaxID=2055947 RepID=A0A364VAP4_9CORY|nr:DNA polymerase I [Corynebacterium heidelbergense]RAV33743.1 DNA polymerase I [Corynebacterium heidelbergense]WCZ36430.1 DNA polymerase I [Corynebacterium heidelbergense]
MTPADANDKPTLLLLDGHSLAFRAFYALPAANFSTTGGQHTNAVYGFLGMFLGLMDNEHPTHVAAAFDLSGPTFREEKFPEYKAQRPAPPQEFRGQVDLIREALQSLGIATLDYEAHEADDVIASLATQAQRAGMRTLICTGDRDSLQLVSQDVTVLYTLKGVSDLHRFTPEAVEEKYGVAPAAYPDLAALRGDTSDNMPGVPGVGPKTAQKWINEYGSLQGVIDHIDEFKGKVGTSLREHIDEVTLAREITEMVRDLQLVDSLEDLRPKPVDAGQTLQFFERLQFGSNLRNRAFRIMGVEYEDTTVRPITVDTPDRGKLASWLSKNLGYRPKGTTAPGPAAVWVAGEQLAIVGGENHGVLLDLADSAEKDEGAVRHWLADPGSPKWVHDAKSSAHQLHAQGLHLDGVEHDAAIAAYLLRPDLRTGELADVLQRYAGRDLPGNASPLDCAQAVAELTGILAAELNNNDLAELYFDLELPLTMILARMETAGIAVDREALEDLSSDYGAKIDEEVTAARQEVDRPKLNLGSPKQLQEVLFEDLDLPKTKKTKTGYSTAAGELEKLAAHTDHPFLRHLMAHREYQKMKTTIDGLIEAIAEDGRIHTTFNQRGAATGRLSSVEPNLQNIPVRTDAGRRIREAFKVGEGYETLLTADYSQIEMRVMAHLSEDAGLIEAYTRGEDLHNFVGSRVFDVPVDAVTPELRRRVKALSYGLVYGLSAFGLSQQLKISGGEAKRIMENYFERFGGVKRYLDQVVEQAREDGYTHTLYGRRRYLPELTSANRVARENAERAALNAPIQGTAADIIKLAMIRVDRSLREAGLKTRVLLQVHDELVLEVAPGELERAKELLVEQMDNAASLRVPLDVSAGDGENWDLAAH